jgi:hypothetical protein
VANQPGVRVEGAAKLARTLRRAGHSLEDLKEANQDVAQFVVERADSRAPRRTGALAATARPARAAGRARVLAGRAGVPYAGPIHWGWEARGIQAQPWIHDTALDNQTQIESMYLDAIEHVLDAIEGA